MTTPQHALIDLPGRVVLDVVVQGDPADVVALCNELGIIRAVIAGHSMGSHVAQRFALDHPDRTAGLVLARVWRDAFEGLLKVDHADRLGSITVPTLLLWGDQDAFCPRSDQDALLEAIPDARLGDYAGAGHALHWEEPARYAAYVASW